MKENSVPIYFPQGERPMHVLVFGSGSGMVLEALLRAQRTLRSPSGAPLFQIKGLFTDRQCRLHEIAEREQIPLIYHSFFQFFKQAGVEDKQDPETRTAYDQKSVELIESCAKERDFSVDLIFLAGYMRLLYPPLLNRFKNKIVNVHPADLTLKNPDGTRKYVGSSAVCDALIAGETRTRSSVILIDEDVDTGPILVSGPWLPYTGDLPITPKRAANHQDRQKQLSDWPACVKAVELIAQGRIAVSNEKKIYVDGVCQEEEGYVVERFEVTEFLEWMEVSTSKNAQKLPAL